MKTKLPMYSLITGIAIWLISLAGMAYFNIYYSVENPDPLNIFKPGAFESLLIVLFGAAVTALGLLAGITALIVSTKRKLSWVAIIVNGLYCIPVAAILAENLVKTGPFLTK